MKNNITILLTTCERYNTTLPLCLLSILNQTRKPDNIVIVDDSKTKAFYENIQIKHLLKIAKFKDIPINYLHGECKGAVPALQRGFETIKEGWILKIDDDNVLSANAIELLENNIKDDIGAMSGLIVDDHAFNRDEKDNKMSYKIEDIYAYINLQMVYNQSDEIKEVEHLYSNYFFRKEALDSFPTYLQPSSYREESIVTYSIFRKNYKMIVIPQIKIFHLETSNGNKKWKKHENNNERVFIEKLKEWNVIPEKLKLFQDKNITYTIKDNIKFIVLDTDDEKI